MGIILTLSIGVIALSVAVVFLCVSVIKLQKKTTYYDAKIRNFCFNIERILTGQESLWNCSRHNTERIDNLELKNFEHKLKQNKMQNKMDALEESLKNKTEFKTNANVFYDTYGYSVPNDMYERYRGFWNSEYTKPLKFTKVRFEKI